LTGRIVAFFGANEKPFWHSRSAKSSPGLNGDALILIYIGSRACPQANVAGAKNMPAVTYLVSRLVSRKNSSDLCRATPSVTPSLRGAQRRSNPLSPLLWLRIASRSLSSGAHSRDPLARNDGLDIQCALAV
jgi:hypothetical protein